MSTLRPFARYLWPWLLCWSAGTLAAPPLPAAPLSEQAPASDHQQSLVALVNRISWGATPADISTAQSLGYEGYLQRQLHPKATLLPADVQSRIAALSISQESSEQAALRLRAATLAAKDGSPETLNAARQAARQTARERSTDTAERSVWLALYSPNQLQEQMTWFWMNHFSVYAPKNQLGLYLDEYESQAIRPHALGKFRDLLAATVRSPAMLIFLDNNQNLAGKINENYAREIMELHTLGVQGGYSQTDVQELARILTGLGVYEQADLPKIRPALRGQLMREGNFLFNPARHDYGDKVFLGHAISGRGLAEVDQAIDLLSRSPATARFISAKLAAYFLPGQPPPALLASMAKTFQSSDGDIAATLNTLFHSPAFNASLKGGVFKDPVHYVYSAVRLRLADLPPIRNPRPALAMLRQLGEPLNQRLTPDGYPQAQSDWSGSGQMTARFEVARSIAAAPQPFYRDPDEQERPTVPPIPALAPLAASRGLYAGLSAATRRAIDSAPTVQDANTYFLASPEFMHR